MMPAAVVVVFPTRDYQKNNIIVLLLKEDLTNFLHLLFYTPGRLIFWLLFSCVCAKDCI
jgi:hypothetical protein